MTESGERYMKSQGTEEAANALARRYAALLALNPELADGWAGVRVKRTPGGWGVYIVKRQVG